MPWLANRARPRNLCPRCSSTASALSAPRDKRRGARGRGAAKNGQCSHNTERNPRPALPSLATHARRAAGAAVGQARRADPAEELRHHTQWFCASGIAGARVRRSGFNPRVCTPRGGRAAARALTKPMSLAYSRKHWRHMSSAYLRIRPFWLPQTRLRGSTRAGHSDQRNACQTAEARRRRCGATRRRDARRTVDAARGRRRQAAACGVRAERSHARCPKALLTEARREALQRERDAPLAAALAVVVRVRVPHRREAHIG